MYYQKLIPDYVTRGVADQVDLLHLCRCVEALTQLKRKGVKADYLQVFRFSYDDKRKVTLLKHTQEQPDYENVIEYEIGAEVRPFEGKLYGIDDGETVTLMLAGEY